MLATTVAKRGALSDSRISLEGNREDNSMQKAIVRRIKLYSANTARIIGSVQTSLPLSDLVWNTNKLMTGRKTVHKIKTPIDIDATRKIGYCLRLMR